MESYIEEYLSADSTLCINPHCKSPDIVGGPVEVDGRSAYQEITCSACGASWVDVYELKSVRDVDI